MDVYNEFGWLDEHLSPGEQVLWRGRPEEGHIFSPADIYVIPFSIMWCGFAIFWEFSAVTMGAPIFFCIWGIPFVAVGLYITVGRFFVQQSIKKQTRYAVTNKKLVRLKRNKVDYLDLHSCGKMHTSVNKDGSGTITFGDNPYQWVRQFNIAPWQMGEQSFALENIPEVNKVYELITEQAKK